MRKMIVVAALAALTLLGGCTLMDGSPTKPLANLRIEKVGNHFVRISWQDPTDFSSYDLSHIVLNYAESPTGKPITIPRDTGWIEVEGIPKNNQEYAFKFWTVDWSGNVGAEQTVKAVPTRLVLRKKVSNAGGSLGYWEYRYGANSGKLDEAYNYDTGVGTLKYFKYDYSDPAKTVQNQYDNYYDFSVDKIPASRIEMVYDSGARLSTETTKQYSTSSEAWETVSTKTYTYDADGHLLGALLVMSGGTAYSYEYVYEVDTWRLLKIDEFGEGTIDQYNADTGTHTEMTTETYSYDDYGDISQVVKSPASGGADIWIWNGFLYY